LTFVVVAVVVVVVILSKCVPDLCMFARRFSPLQTAAAARRSVSTDSIRLDCGCT